MGTVRKGVGSKLVDAAWSTRSTVGKLIPNYGVTHISLDGTTVAETYILDAPDEGVEKKIFVTGTTVSSAKVLTIRANPTSAGAVKIERTADALLFNVSSAAAVDGGIHLVGVNSTKWAIVASRATTVSTF
jgi:hypothetical protein